MLNYNLTSIIERYQRQNENIFHKIYHFNFNEKESCERNLEEIKNNLNYIKRKTREYNEPQLIHKKWKEYTKYMHVMSNTSYLKDQCQSKFCTKAYFKCRELLSLSYGWFLEKYKQKKKINILNLCEAPGAFVYAIHDFYNLPNIETSNKYFNWKMNSLNPFIEGNNIEAFKDETGLMKLFNENMFYGDDNTGNIFNFTDNDVKNIIKDGKYDFITADGSINTVKCQDSQEKIVFPLIEKEVAIALECLNENGIFIIKMYTFFEEETQQLLRKLCKSFEKIFVVKPCFSKSSNSEVYVVLQNYLKRINCINEEYFIDNIIKCSELFASYQIEAIQTNIDAFNNNLLDSKVIKSIFNTIKKEVINDYFEKRMKTISNTD